MRGWGWGEARAPTVDPDSGLLCLGLSWRTSSHWTPDQTQECVALTLSSNLKLRQAGHAGVGVPGLDSLGAALRVATADSGLELPSPRAHPTAWRGLEGI